MYAVPGALFLYFVIRLATDATYRTAFLQSKLAIASLILFLLGAVMVLISVGHLKEVLWFARKGLCLLMVPALVLAFKDQANRQAAFWGLLLGFWVNVVVVVTTNLGTSFAGRIEGIWYLGPWDALLGLYVAFLLPMVFAAKPPVAKPLIWTTFVAALILLVLSGGRAPWVATAVIVLIYLVLFYKKTLVVVVVAGVLAALALTQLSPAWIQPKLDRVASIANTEDSGNWVRLRLWSLGLDHLAFYAKNKPLTLIAGAGPITYHEEQKSFFAQQNYPPVVKERLSGYGYPTGDTHNMYLDSSLRMGIVWTALFLVFVAALALVPSHADARRRVAPWLVLGSYLIVGMFYTTILSFVTFFVLFILTLTTAMCSEKCQIALPCLSTVELKNLQIRTQIGTYGPEDVVPDTHVLDLTLTIAPELVLIEQDGMASVFDYDPLVKEIDRLAQAQPYETQERLMTLMVYACARYKPIQAIDITLSKRPVLNQSGSLGVRLVVNAQSLAALRAQRLSLA